MIKRISLGAALALFVLFSQNTVAAISSSVADVETVQSKPEQEEPKTKNKNKKKASEKKSCCSSAEKKSCGEKKTETK